MNGKAFFLFLFFKFCLHHEETTLEKKNLIKKIQDGEDLNKNLMCCNTRCSFQYIWLKILNNNTK